jgi:hypothetical protein
MVMQIKLDSFLHQVCLNDAFALDFQSKFGAISEQEPFMSGEK